MTGPKQDGVPAANRSPDKIIIKEPGPGIEDPIHIRPAPPDPSAGIEFLPEVEALEGPTEASDNKDSLTPPETDGPRLVDPTVRG